MRSVTKAQRIGTSTTFGCYVFLTKSMLGSGMLQLSSVCLAYGWVLGIGLCIFAALMTIVALIFNTQLARDHPGPKITFYTVSKHISPAACWVIDIACIADCFGASVGYIQVAGMMMSQILLEQHHACMTSITTLSRYVQLLVIGILTPFCFIKGVSKTAILSAVGLMCIVYVIFIPLVYAGSFDTGIIRPAWPLSFWGSMRKLPVFFAAYSCMQNLFTVVGEIDIFTTKRVSLVCAGAVLTGLLIYLVVMLVPFYTFGESTKLVFLDNYDKKLLPVKLAFIATAVQVSIGFVLVIYPTRQSIISLWYREETPEENKEIRLRVVITTILIASSLGIALWTNRLDTVTEITGLIGANTYCFTAPSYMFYIRYHPKYYRDYDILGRRINPYSVIDSGRNSSPHFRGLWYASIVCLLISAFLYPVCLTAIIYGIAQDDH